ncbi:MAG TPA: PEP-CTERM sorting domain-containing protein [Luteolibacter sp.]
MLPLLSLCLAASLPCAHAANVLLNNNFEAFSIDSGNYNLAFNSTTNPDGYTANFSNGTPPKLSRQYQETATGMGWLTTAPDNNIEIWQSGHTSVPSADGTGQFAEINANTSAALYQDVTIDLAGLVDYSFLHRGRSGTDTLQVTITYLGLDNQFGTGDDQVMVAQQFSTGNSAWVLYDQQDQFTSVANGVYRFSFGAVSSAGGDLSFGNFIDNVNFGVAAAPVPEPSAALLGGLGVLGLFGRRRRA